MLDLSLVNGFATQGETTKSLGVLSRDRATSDTHWQIGSGHHPVLNLNNFGVSSSRSGEARLASLLWSAGDFANGPSKRGNRGGALLQFGKEDGRDQWSLRLRSLAPWAAIHNRYERWSAEERIAEPGVFRTTGSLVLESLDAGLTGRSPPTGKFGRDLVDGSVRWRIVDSADRSILRVTERGNVLLGLGDLSASYRHKVSSFHPGNFVSERAAAGISRDAIDRLIPTGANGEEVKVPGFRASASAGLAVVDPGDMLRPIARFEARRGMVIGQSALDGTTATPQEGRLNASQLRLIYVAGTGQQRLDRLVGGASEQELSLHFLGSGTVVSSGASAGRMLLQDSRPFTPQAHTVLHLRKLPDRLGGFWVETGRSEK
ncbi:hypothetical protein [Parerythrobacter jejuensis]|uniref:Uncharacterized protein n=1 Tax=Parerythrobacter jejuensis TaxID=795812 RepID=A0A845ARX4_9SPHN|nr:hypothetical protein [Parerythrobacter jejuensis]MXP30872.1 hypothetical protein [Parerythrobacter jejuensis]MXP33632.1 hypothetical protein [Parerythrobacter jejuensis]